MAWFDRLKEAAYTPPSGVRIVAQYEDVRHTIDKKTTGFDFPDAEGTLVQDNGVTGRKYPLRFFFWGADYDLEANAFSDALAERGVGKLEHPIYGTVDVVPFGTITRRDDLKTGGNQAIFDVVFWDTIGVIYPIGQVDPASSVLNAVDEYNAAASEGFFEAIDLDTAIKRVTVKNTYQALLDVTQSGLQVIADTQDDVRTQFNAIYDSINQGIDVLINDPLTMAFQAIQLIQTPARAISDIRARLDAYGNLADSIISGNDAVVNVDDGEEVINSFQVRDLYASTYVSGQIVSVVNNEFLTKTEALEAADVVLSKFSEVAAWRDDNYQVLGTIESTTATVDTGGAYQQLQEAVAIAAGFLVQISFTLKQERSLTLDRNRTIVDLVAELYGSIDDQLDFFINSNNLSGSEILELPKGRTIVYYV